MSRYNCHVLNLVICLPTYLHQVIEVPRITRGGVWDGRPLQGKSKGLNEIKKLYQCEQYALPFCSTHSGAHLNQIAQQKAVCNSEAPREPFHRRTHHSSVLFFPAA